MFLHLIITWEKQSVEFLNPININWFLAILIHAESLYHFVFVLVRSTPKWSSHAGIPSGFTGIKDIFTGVKDGISTVLNFGKDILNTPGIKDAINMGGHAFGVPVNVCDMISSGVDVASNLFGGGGGSQKKKIYSETQISTTSCLT
jgi:hypothetical protein